MEKKYLAIEIGGTKLQVVIGNDSGKIVERLRYDIVKQHAAEGIKKQIEEAINYFKNENIISAIGIGFGGPVDRKKNKIRISFQIEGWGDSDLVHWIQTLIDVPVFIENDGNVAALGEAIHGAGKNFEHVFYITLGSGVGGGLCIGGQIYHGKVPGEAEIGHIRLDRNGNTVESSCSGWAVDKKIRNIVDKEPDCILALLVKDAVSGEAKYLKPALDQGDPFAENILKELAEDIAFGLSHVVHLFHPEVIVLGGGLSLIGDPLRSKVETGIQQHIMEAFLPGPHIVLSQLKEDVVPIGALELAHKNFLKSYK